MENNLTINEKNELETLEGIIGREMGSFIAVGKALLTIRDTLLYREDFKTFPAYCTGKWGLGRHQACNLIRGSQVATNLLTAVTTSHPCETQPVYERQVRPLAQLEPAQQCEVWEEAVRTYVVDHPGKAPTYSHVKAAVKEYVGPAPPAPPAPPKKIAPYSDAFNFVAMAMANLMRIMDDDPRKFEAMESLTKWIQEKITEWTKKVTKKGKGE